MYIVGIDVSKAEFDAALLVGACIRHAAFSNTEAGFEQLLAWLARHHPDQPAPVHACMEATGNWGLDLAAFLHGRGVQESVVDPARIEAYSDSELARKGRPARRGPDRAFLPRPGSIRMGAARQAFA